MGEHKFISVLGGNGFLGKYIVNILLNKGYYVKIISRSATLSKQNFTIYKPGQYKLVNCDIKNSSKLHSELEGTNYIINLASNEYFKSIDKNKLKAKIITPIFKNIHNGKLKVIGIFAKKARGQMTKFILKNKISEIEDIKKFNIDHYTFNKELSNSTDYIFTR